MKVIRQPKKITAEIRRLKLKNRKIGFVPTMGALHEGHLSLIRQAASDNDVVVVSIFVNPAQFGPKEDFKKYPRPLSEDLSLCRKEGVDFVFLPRNKDMYPKGYKTFVEVEGLSGLLCGLSRPGHFRGVSTVVAKLLNIVSPDVIYLGQKDAQQALIIRRMVEDLNMPVKVKVMPTLREKNGLAMSSRNAYLKPKEREDSLVLNQSLELCRKMVASGEKDTARIIDKMRRLICRKNARVDYIAIVNADKLIPLNKISGKCLVALSVKFGKTRLIDNVIIG